MLQKWLLWFVLGLPTHPLWAKSEAAKPAKKSPTVIAFIGDSLTAGYGVAEKESYPRLIEQKLKASGRNVRVVNAGESGATSAIGVARIQWVMRSSPNVLVLALGSNDGLRGIKVDATKKNIEQMIAEAQKRQVKVILAGLKVPPNYGPEYTKAFDAMYPAIAKQMKVPLIPFLLEGVAGNGAMNQADKIHPNAKGHQVIANLVYEHLGPLL